jgi:hypothetical protein
MAKDTQAILVEPTALENSHQDNDLKDVSRGGRVK